MTADCRKSTTLCDIVSAVEREQSSLFNRRACGPPRLQRFIEKDTSKAAVKGEFEIWDFSSLLKETFAKAEKADAGMSLCVRFFYDTSSKSFRRSEQAAPGQKREALNAKRRKFFPQIRKRLIRPLSVRACWDSSFETDALFSAAVELS